MTQPETCRHCGKTQEWHHSYARSCGDGHGTTFQPGPTYAELTALAEKLERENGELHSAFRKSAINADWDNKTIKYCAACDGTWREQEPEKHATGCLAAPRKGSDV